MIRLSIIIPHYNSPTLLGKLLKTIPKREDIQTIVIDDHSDQDLPVYESLSHEFSWVTFIKNSKAFQSAGACRNTGIEHAVGKWVIFADADDYFAVNFYNVIQEYFDSTYEVIFFSPRSIYLQSGKEAERHKKFKKRIDQYLEYPNQNTELLLRYRLSNMISKMINKEIIDRYKLRFDEVLASNDIMFSIQLGHYMEKFHVSQETIYYITHHNRSLSARKSEKYFMDRLQVHIRYHNFLQENLSKEEYDKFEFRSLYMLRQSLNLGFKKTLETINALRDNNIRIFGKRMWNPLYAITHFLKFLNNQLGSWMNQN